MHRGHQIFSAWLSLLELLDFERALLDIEIERADAIRDASRALLRYVGGMPADAGEMD